MARYNQAQHKAPKKMKTGEGAQAHLPSGPLRQSPKSSNQLRPIWATYSDYTVVPPQKRRVPIQPSPPEVFRDIAPEEPQVGTEQSHEEQDWEAETPEFNSDNDNGRVGYEASGRLGANESTASRCNFHVARVGFVGLPNAGKSSLVNCLAGGVLVSAISNKVNTTRDRVEAIASFPRERTQLLLVDLPGIAASHQKQFCRELTDTAWTAIDDVDIIVVVVDVTRRPCAQLRNVLHTLHKVIESPPESLGESTNGAHVDSLTNTHPQVVLVLNKLDLLLHCPRNTRWQEVVASREEELRKAFPAVRFVTALCCNPLNRMVALHISREPLELLQRHLCALAREVTPPASSWYYNPNLVTPMSEARRVQEVIRSFVFRYIHKDTPYKIEQRLAGWTSLPDGTLQINYNLVTLDSGMLRAVVGHEGSRIRAISQHASAQLSKLFRKSWTGQNIANQKHRGPPKRVFVKLHVISKKRSRKDRVKMGTRKTL